MPIISIYFGFLVFSFSILSSTIGQNVDNKTVAVPRVSPAATVSSSSKDIHFNVYSDPLHPDSYIEIFIGDTARLANCGLVPGPLIILIGGFMSDSDLLLLKDGKLYGREFGLVYSNYLSQGMKNIVVVDSNKLSEPVLKFPLGFISYFAALKNVPKVGKKGADLINFLVKNKKVKDTGDIHLIGMSLGTHKCASIGRYLQERYKMTVGRITGLEVAGPFMYLLGKNQFNKKYGKFVDAIHSDIDGFGTPKSLAHADFFMNGGKGRSQADCGLTDPFTNILCAHESALLLYRQTVTKEKEYIGCSCTSSLVPPAVCVENVGKCADATIVGEYCPTRARGNYYVKVTEKLGVLTEQLSLIFGDD